MASREQRRAKKLEKKAAKQNIVEKKRTQHPVMWFLSVLVLIVVVVAFVVAPTFGGMGGGERLIFGYYNGEPIEYEPDSYFARQRDAYAERIESQSQQDSDNYQWQAMQVWKGAYDMTVVHTAILQQADKSGLVVSEKKLDRNIAKYGPYRENDEFSAELYRSASNSEKVATRELFRENLIHDQWTQDLASIPSPEAEQEFLQSMASPERKFRYVSFSLNNYPDDEVVTYAEENSRLFDKMNLSRISLRMKENEARKIYQQLEESPERFEELAQNHSSDENAEKGGDMGWVRYHELVGAFEESEKADMIFALNRGELTGLIETSFGWAIYRCDEPAVTPDFNAEEEIEDVRSYLIRNERGQVEDYFINRAQTFVSNAREAGFSTAAATANLESTETQFFPINYGGSFFLKQIQSDDGNGLLQRAQSNQRVLTSLFSVAQNDFTEPFVLGNSVVVAQLMEERQAPEQEVQQIANYHSYIMQNFRQQETRTHFLQSDKLEDNFMQVFSKYFLNS
ncbi:MAG: peptidylprolyl isomerase [Spirochaetota bacterium]